MAGLVLTSPSLLPQRDCQNYIKILQPLNSSHLFTCGTGAFSPLCTYIVSAPPAAGLGPAPSAPARTLTGARQPTSYALAFLPRAHALAGPRDRFPHPCSVTFSRTPSTPPRHRANSSPGLPLSPPVCPLQNVDSFTLARDEAGNVLLEDGKGRCPFDPNFKSTALMVGKCWGQGGLLEAGGGGARQACFQLTATLGCPWVWLLPVPTPSSVCLKRGGQGWGHSGP